MNRIKSWIRMFFGFSRTETNAFLILLPLMCVLIFVIPAYRKVFHSPSADFEKEKKELDSIIAAWKIKEAADSSTVKDEFKLFRFDPNVATGSELADLGFTPAMAKRIETYRSKGGKFRIKSDLLKIYGMDTAFYKMLYAFIDLPDARQEFKKETASGRQSEQQVIKEKFDLNLADTTQLKKIYGIGSKLSARIVKYRESLGGFISMNQLQEVYGLDSVVIKEIRKNTFINPDFSPRTISVNTATEKELSAHPYINYSLAKAITTYRFQHGKFSNPDELRKIQLLNETTFEKIKPYLSLTP